MKLKNKVALVTGAAKSKSIGRAVALEFAKEGADIVIADILEKDGNDTCEVIKKIERNCLFLKTDVSKTEDVQKMVDDAIKRFGKIDILANVAGISRAGKIVDVEENDWDAVMNINLKGVFLCSKYVGKQMIKQKNGKIINMSSIAGKRAENSNVPYCASKSGVISITEGMAQEMAPYRINVNAICPGATDTVLMEQVFIERGPVLGISQDECRKRFERGIPLGRMAKPEEIGKLAVFIASKDSDYITGQAYNISGGLELTLPGL